MAYVPRLKERYETEIRPALKEHFGYANLMQVPRPVKVCITMGVSDAVKNAETLERAMQEVSRILGQRPCVSRARKSVANFGVREGQPIGLRATLRRDHMWEFVDRLFSVVIPRIRDFRGLPRESMDGRGSYSFGITDLLIFPELGYDDVEKTRGMNLTLTTSARTDEAGRELLMRLGLPLKAAE